MRFISFFIYILALVVALKIFSPGLAAELLILMTNVVVIANRILTALTESADQGSINLFQ